MKFVIAYTMSKSTKCQKISRLMFEIAVEVSKCLEHLSSQGLTSNPRIERIISDFLLFTLNLREYIRNGIRSIFQEQKFPREIKSRIEEVFSEKITSKTKLFNTIAESSHKTLFPKMEFSHERFNLKLSGTNLSIDPNQQASQITEYDIHHSNKCLNYIEKLDEMFIESSNETQCIVSMGNDKFLIGQFNGKIEIRYSKNPDFSYIFQPGLVKRVSRIRSMIRDKQGRVWVNTNDSLMAYDRNNNIVFYMKGVETLHRLLGQTKTLWYDSKFSKMLWWCSIGSFAVIDTRSLKKLIVITGILHNENEYPSDFTMVDGKWKDVLILLMNDGKASKRFYHSVKPALRKVFHNRVIPTAYGTSPSAYISIASDSPSTQVVMTGTVRADHAKALISIFSFSGSELTLRASDSFDGYPLMTRPYLITEKIILALMIRDVLLFEFKEGKILLLCRILDLNRGDSVNNIEKLNKSNDDLLFVGNCGQIFRIKLKSAHLSTNV